MDGNPKPPDSEAFRLPQHRNKIGHSTNRCVKPATAIGIRLFQPFNRCAPFKPFKS
jgi:hypothetical protein